MVYKNGANTHRMDETVRNTPRRHPPLILQLFCTLHHDTQIISACMHSLVAPAISSLTQTLVIAQHMLWG